MTKNGNIILNSLTEAEKQVKQLSNIPSGYLEVQLSTKGKLGAPAIVHVRNFKVSEILTLSMSDKSQLPVRLVNILNDCILEDVDVANWHEKEIEELMVYIFMTFYKSTIEDMPYPYTEDEIKGLDAEQIKDLKEGKWIPRVNINIAESVDTYDIDKDFDPHITITNKKTGFYVTFNYIKYGDQIKIKKWMDSYFAEDESRFAKIKNQLEFNEGISNQLLDNPSKIDKLITIDKSEEEEYKNYLMRRAQVITDVANIVSIVNYNGEDVSNLSIGEKYEKLAGDARIDYNLIVKLSKRQAKMNYGIKPDVTMRSPITREVVKRPLSFRISTLIQAMQLSGNDDYDDGFNDED